MGYLTKIFYKWPLQKNKLSKVLSTKFGRLMMSTNQELSIKKRPRNSFKILLVTSDPVMNSLPQLSIRITPVPSKRTRWSCSSNNSSEDNDHDEKFYSFEIYDLRLMKKDYPQIW